MIAYPPTLPKPLITGYSYSEFEHYRQNDVEAGAPRRELLTHTTPMRVSVNFIFKPLDFQIFEAWYKSLLWGTVPFEIELQVGMGIVLHECYMGQWTPSRAGKLITVSAQMLAIEKKYNTDAEVQTLVALGALTSDFDKLAFLSLLEEFALITLPDEWEVINYGTDYS